MKILFVGNLNPVGRSYQRKRVLEDIGHDVMAISWVPEGRTFWHKPSLVSRVLWKIGIPLDLTSTNKRILQEIGAIHYDIVWIEKGNTIWPRTLRSVKKLSPTTQIVSYTEDDMFALHNSSWFYTWGLRHYDVVFTTKSYNCNQDELPALGAKRVVFVDKAYDRHAHRPVELTEKDRQNFGADVGFIGSYERDRAESMLFLAQNDISVRVWGTRWDRFPKSHPNLIMEYKPLYGEDYANGLCATRINLCFLRKMNRDLQTDRTMEIPACGTFMLAERTNEHLRLFKEDKEAVYFSSNQELLKKVRYYLEHEDDRRAIALAGRQRCLSSCYSHHDRLEYMLSVL